MKSKTKIDKQSLRKTNTEVVNTIRAAKKSEKWLEVASLLSRPKRKMAVINLDQINKENLKGEDLVVVAGKVLSIGEIKGKFKIAALNFSEKAKEKLKKEGCETLSILEAIKLSPDAKGIKIIK